MAGADVGQERFDLGELGRETRAEAAQPLLATAASAVCLAVVFSSTESNPPPPANCTDWKFSVRICTPPVASRREPPADRERVAPVEPARRAMSRVPVVESTSTSSKPPATMLKPLPRSQTEAALASR